MTDLHDAPPRDWATEFDHTKEDYAADAPAVWAELRDRCPVAHSDAHGGVWLPSATRTSPPSPTTPSTSAPRA
ncbi:MAG: hypothetical protein R2746_13265 [Acidimicrobiales bacterium]